MRGRNGFDIVDKRAYLSLKMKNAIIILAIISILLVSCSGQPKDNGQTQAKEMEKQPEITRESRIPADAVKMTPETDVAPPKSKSEDYNDPVLLSPAINSAGAEDSPFMMPDGNMLYFFFTPDVRVPVEKQLLDGVTGIWVSKKTNGEWGRPERVMLQDPKKLSLDGCEYVYGNRIWFCTVREGYTGIHWFTAEFKDGKWQDWKNADFNPDYKVGELHMTNDGNELYYHSDRPGGKGGLDIWVSKKVNGEWQQPENVAAVNSEGNEGWPALSPDENELWIYKDYGLLRSKKVNGQWQTPEPMFSPLAGEATLDNEGNVYFVHHYFKDDKMIEADIYVAYRK